MEEKAKIPSLADVGGKRLASRGVKTGNAVEEMERKLVAKDAGVGMGMYSRGVGSEAEIVLKASDRKRFSTMVRILGESEADWVDEALERHGIVLPGGVKATRMAAATEAMFHAAVADKNVGAYVALRDTGWGKPKEEIEIQGETNAAIPIKAEVLADMRRARDAGKVIDVNIDGSVTDVVVEKNAGGEFDVAEAKKDEE